MDTGSQSIIPLGAIDRMVGTYVGGSDTGTYYSDVYGAQQPNSVQGIPIETITITPTTSPGSQLQTGTNSINQVGATFTTEAPGTVNISPPAVASTVIKGVFSFAVTASIICAIFVLYVIIRTRQLHHHEEHIRGVGHGSDGHGHAPTPHNDAHAPAQAHDVVAHTEAVHEAQAEELRHGTHEPVEHERTIDVVHGDGLSDVGLPTDGEEVALKYASDDPLSIRHHALKIYIQSKEEQDWRYALMDMDLLLDDALLRHGYSGNNTEDKLLRIHDSNLRSLESARKAHDAYIALVADDTLLTQESIQNLYTLYQPAYIELGV